MKFCLGAAQFGQPYGLDKTYFRNIETKFNNIIEWNKKNNFFEYIDTAYKYGNSEKIIGSHNYKNNKLKIITKVSLDKNTKSLNNLKANFDSSLDKLNTKSVYGVMIHNKEMFLKKNINITLNFLDYLKTNKLCKKIGLSVYNKTELQKNLKYYDFDLIQIPLNLFDQSFIKENYLNDISNKYEIFLRSVFLQGLLLQDKKNLDKYFNKYKNNVLKKYYNFLKEHNFTPLEACLIFIYSLNVKANIIFGINNINQIVEISDLVKKIEKKDFNNSVDFSILRSRFKKLNNPSYWKLAN